MADFTPGPWYLEEAWGKGKNDPGPLKFCFVEIRKVDDEHVPVASTNSTSSREAQLANAHLIAAGPTMFDALEQVQELLEGIDADRLSTSEFRDLEKADELLASAIKLARGEK